MKKTRSGTRWVCNLKEIKEGEDPCYSIAPDEISRYPVDNVTVFEDHDTCSRQCSLLHRIPADALQHILSFANFDTLLSLSKASKQVKEEARANKLMHELANVRIFDDDIKSVENLIAEELPTLTSGEQQEAIGILLDRLTKRYLTPDKSRLDFLHILLNIAAEKKYTVDFDKLRTNLIQHCDDNNNACLLMWDILEKSNPQLPMLLPERRLSPLAPEYTYTGHILNAARTFSDYFLSLVNAVGQHIAQEYKGDEKVHKWTEQEYDYILNTLEMAMRSYPKTNVNTLWLLFNRLIVAFSGVPPEDYSKSMQMLEVLITPYLSKAHVSMEIPTTVRLLSTWITNPTTMQDIVNEWNPNMITLDASESELMLENILQEVRQIVPVNDVQRRNLDVWIHKLEQERQIFAKLAEEEEEEEEEELDEDSDED